jgi:hypothetical protein
VAADAWNDLRSTGKELLDLFATLDLDMYDLGMGGPDPYPVKPVTDDVLLRRFAPTRKWFTHLLLLKAETT